MGRKPKAKGKPKDDVHAAPKHAYQKNGSSSMPMESMEQELTSHTGLPAKNWALENSLPSKDNELLENATPSSLPSKKKSTKKASSKLDGTVRRSGRIRNLWSAKPNQKKIVEEIDLGDIESEEESLDQQSNLEPLVQQLNSKPLVQQLNLEPIQQHMNTAHLVQEVNTEPLVQQLNSEPIPQQLNAAHLVQEANTEPLVQQVNTQPLVQQVNSEHPIQPFNLEEKINFLVQSVEEFKSQIVPDKKRSFPSDTRGVELNYRSLYIDSQKKIEALAEENHQLAKKLESASGKVEAYEKMKDIFGNLKDIMLVSHLERATEAAISLSAQAAAGRLNLPETTNGAAHEQRNTSNPAHKKYFRKKK